MPTEDHPITRLIDITVEKTEESEMKVTGNIAFTITELTSDRVVGTMPVQPGILNPFGVAHAGAMLWFADVCATVLTFGKSDVPSGESGFPLGINLNAAFLGNQKDGAFTATSVFVKKGRTLSVVRTAITGDDGRVIADITTSHIPAK
jgi:1,4-dihydroxy-2-naphthoyl-CoA hydrolase